MPLTNGMGAKYRKMNTATSLDMGGKKVVRNPNEGPVRNPAV